jgi:hypothetical protein
VAANLGDVIDVRSDIGIFRVPPMHHIEVAILRLTLVASPRFGRGVSSRGRLSMK